MFAIIGGDIYTPSYQSTGNIFTRGGKIESISTEPFDPTEHQLVTTINATGCSVIPGLIDAQVHGGGGADTLISDAEDLEKAARAHAAHGVTSLVLTIPSASMERINRSLKTVGYLVDNPVVRASLDLMWRANLGVAISEVLKILSTSALRILKISTPCGRLQMGLSK